MARIKEQTYEDFLKKASYQELEIQINYWSTLIDRYKGWNDKVKLTEAKNNLKLVKSYVAKYEEKFLDDFKQECPYMAQTVTLDMAREFLQKYAANNVIFKPSADLFRDYLLANNILNEEDIEL